MPSMVCVDLEYTSRMSEKLIPNGLDARSDFPAQQYDAVHIKVAAKWSDHPLYIHFSGSWNALAYRFQGASDAGIAFNVSLKEQEN